MKKNEEQRPSTLAYASRFFACGVLCLTFDDSHFTERDAALAFGMAILGFDELDKLDGK